MRVRSSQPTIASIAIRTRARLVVKGVHTCAVSAKAITMI